jgi:uncharacterized protein (DUF486 family)
MGCVRSRIPFSKSAPIKTVYTPLSRRDLPIALTDGGRRALPCAERAEPDQCHALSSAIFLEVTLPQLGFSNWIAPIALLSLSNIFMTFAWYGHLKYKGSPLFLAILASWGIAFFEYCLAVPANRWGHSVYATAELKTIQEVITLAVFAGFSIFYLKEPLTLNHLVGFALIVAGAYFVFRGPL